MSVIEYVLKIKSLVDALDYAGHTISKLDHIYHILSSLCSEFAPFLVSV